MASIQRRARRPDGTFYEPETMGGMRREGLRNIEAFGRQVGQGVLALTRRAVLAHQPDLVAG